jgi:hypothetical protein
MASILPQAADLRAAALGDDYHVEIRLPPATVVAR